VPFVVLVLAVLLNCIVPASFARPAVIYEAEPYLTTALTFVAPTTRWELKQRFVERQTLAYYYAPEESDIWCVDMRYTVQLIDPVNEPLGWRRWSRVIVENMVHNAANQYMQTLGNVTQEEVLEALTEIFQDPEIQQAIIDAFTTAFSSRYGGITFPVEMQATLSIRRIEVTARHVPMSEYREYVEGREK
jgi:hypothetical protein